MHACSAGANERIGRSQNPQILASVAFVRIKIREHVVRYLIFKVIKIYRIDNTDYPTYLVKA